MELGLSASETAKGLGQAERAIAARIRPVLVAVEVEVVPRLRVGQAEVAAGAPLQVPPSSKSTPCCADW
jgi:hypothetical protein